MLRRTSKKLSRRGTAIAETAAVISVFFLLLFGIVEYCRFIFVQQLITAAAREGARYAVVNSTDTTLVSDTQSQVTQVMGGVDTKLNNFTVQLYQANSSGVNDGAATDAQFGAYMAVQIDCDYSPILPTFLLFNQTSYHMTAKCLMCSEAN